jgi:two-component system response regulator MprA
MTPGGALVMVVDDDDDLREALIDVLELAGHRTAAMRDGAEAVMALRGGVRPDLILLDLMMPRMTGWEVHDALRASPALAQLRVVVMTARRTGDGPDAPAGVEVIHKPFALEGLLAVVERNLRAPTARAGWPPAA